MDENENVYIGIVDWSIRIDTLTAVMLVVVLLAALTRH